MYMKAKPYQLGYQKRLKLLWDENYPEFNCMTAKHLAQQIRNIKTSNLLSELERQVIERSAMGNLA